jgi:hypothetical protein
MNLVQCLYMEKPVFPGGASETGRVEVDIFKGHKKHVVKLFSTWIF